MTACYDRLDIGAVKIPALPVFLFVRNVIFVL
jgi:hypothetical protein